MCSALTRLKAAPWLSAGRPMRVPRDRPLRPDCLGNMAGGFFLWLLSRLDLET